MKSYRPLSLLPQNYPKEEHSLDIANSVFFKKISLEIQKIPNFFNPKYIDAEFLDYLSYSTANDVYFMYSNLTEEEKRELLQMWLTVHRKKGTIWSIKRMFEALGTSAEIDEWFDYDGIPYHFRLSFSQKKELDKNSVLSLFFGIKQYKNVKSILDYIYIENIIKKRDELHSSIVQLVEKNKYNRTIEQRDELHSSIVQLVEKNEYNRIIEQRDELHSSIVQLVEKNKYNRTIEQRDELHSSIVQLVEKNEYFKNILNQTNIQGGIICQI